jgi:hypothetical protein
MDQGMLTSLLGRVAINREGLKTRRKWYFILLPESCRPRLTRMPYYPYQPFTAKQEGSWPDQLDQFDHALLSSESPLIGHLTTILNGFSVNAP